MPCRLLAFCLAHAPDKAKDGLNPVMAQESSKQPHQVLYRQAKTQESGCLVSRNSIEELLRARGVLNNDPLSHSNCLSFLHYDSGLFAPSLPFGDFPRLLG